jgi:hypothetical protein
MEKQTWYSIHKEQIKLVQWLLYHLRKHSRVQVKEESRIKLFTGDFTVRFD